MIFVLILSLPDVIRYFTSKYYPTHHPIMAFSLKDSDKMYMMPANHNLSVTIDFYMQLFLVCEFYKWCLIEINGDSGLV